MFERVREWVLWSPRRAAGVAVVIAALLLVSVAVGVVGAGRSPATTPTPAASSPGVDVPGCRAAVLAWSRIFPDSSLPAGAWEQSVMEVSTPRTRVWLPYTDRALIPAGPVTVEHVDADAHTCTVQVVFAGGASWEVRAVPEGDGWLVDGWDDGS